MTPAAARVSTLVAAAWAATFDVDLAVLLTLADFAGVFLDVFFFAAMNAPDLSTHEKKESGEASAGRRAQRLVGRGDEGTLPAHRRSGLLQAELVYLTNDSPL